MPRRNLIWVCTIGLVSLFGWTLAQGSLAPPRGPLQFIRGFPGYQEDYQGVNLLVDVLQQVEQNYVEQLSAKERRKFFEEAIEGGLQSLDLHSGFINPTEYKQFQRQSEGSFGGVGIQITINRDTKRLTVISPIVGTPAYKAGIKPGDEIEKINGEPTLGMSSEDAVDKIQGPPGTDITLSVRHRGSYKLVDMKMTRSRIEVESVLGDQRDADKSWDFMIDKKNRIGYVRLVQFSQRSLDELTAALEKLERQNVRGLVLDMRGNPGGLLTAAVKISDLFLTQGKIVSVEGRVHPSEGYDAMEDGTVLEPASSHPMAILINEGSASASEIVAAALQDHGRAVVFGERSFGKGSVQNLIPMESGQSALKLTTAKYIRPSGKNIHRFPKSKEEDEWGVRPDIEVKLGPMEELDYLRGRQDRDIVRDDEISPDVREKLTALTMPIWTACSPGHFSLGAAAGAAEFATAYKSLPKDASGKVTLGPKPFVDKVLDKALDHLRNKLNG